jgi:hypothetical protein
LSGLGVGVCDYECIFNEIFQTVKDLYTQCKYNAGRGGGAV